MIESQSENNFNKENTVSENMGDVKVYTITINLVFIKYYKLSV